MKQNKTIIIVCAFLLNLQLSAQDIHFTDYRNVSNFFNPAMTGDFLGQIKIQGTARTQYERNYETGMLGGQVNVFSPLNNSHWVGIGANILFDQSGTLNLRTTGGELNVGYHIPMGKKGLSTISLGGGFSAYNLSINTQNYRSELQILGQTDPDLNILNGFNPLLISFQAGVYFKSTINKKHLFKMGAATTHLNNPEFKALGSANNPSFGRRWNALILYDWQLSKYLNIEPAIFYSISEKQNNTNLQIIAGWNPHIEKQRKFLGGITHRLQESVGIIIGYQTDSYRLSLSFDVLTGLSSDLLRNPGAIELGGYYIFKNHKKPKVKPIIACPRL